jgi:hypothetical protein
MNEPGDAAVTSAELFGDEDTASHATQVIGARTSLHVRRLRLVVQTGPAAGRRRSPCVAAQVPLAANALSPGSAAGARVRRSSQCVPSSVRASGNFPSCESAIRMPCRESQNAMQSKKPFASGLENCKVQWLPASSVL